MPISRNEVADKVYSIVAELAHMNVNEIKPTDRLRDDLGLDSMQSMELLSRVSEEFDIDPDMEQSSRIDTVEQVVHLLAGLLEAA
jgi:acyl carrier protein